MKETHFLEDNRITISAFTQGAEIRDGSQASMLQYPPAGEMREFHASDCSCVSPRQKGSH